MIRTKIYFLIFLAFGLTTSIFADDNKNEIPKDTLQHFNINEIVVVATPKESRNLRELPSSVSIISHKQMETMQINSIKDLTGTVPNIFIPDYGSKLTSAIYIRGIGSRINTPSVGLYVDNVPYIDKSAFDFDFSNVERIDILRGPQSTLYGRNTMGGLVKVYSKSPFNYQGTDLKLGMDNYNSYKASVTHYHRVSNNFAFSTGVFYNHTGGFFKDVNLDKKIDKGNTVGGKFRGVFIPSSNLKLDLNMSYEYTDEGGYAYGRYDKKSQIYQDPAMSMLGSYRRGIYNTGLNIEYQADNFDISAITGYQHLSDRMYIDQDFSPADIFTIMQNQNLNTISEEIMLKSKPNRRWEWTTGLFGFAQGLRTDGPVWFHEDGINMLNQMSTMGAQQGMKMMEQMLGRIPGFPPNTKFDGQINLKSDELLIDGTYNTPVYGAAAYHQSTIHDLFFKGLSATAGLRFNYEANKLKYRSNSLIDYDFQMDITGMGPRPISKIYEHSDHPDLNGNLKKSHIDLLPRFAIQYDFDKKNSIYITASKGYRSGGYNIQMFSDLIQDEMKKGMEKAVLISSMEFAGDRMPQNIKDMLLGRLDQGEQLDIEATTVYKPEYTWNYELGSHLNLFDDQLTADFAIFCMDTKDQQIAKFAKSGLGRTTVNAGKSRSYGAEANLYYKVNKNLGLRAAYGYTYATFTKYETNKKNNGTLETINYKGKYVPFVPKHTLNTGFDLNFKLANNQIVDRITFNADYIGAGRIYWTESNDVSQKFYSTVNTRLSFIKGRGHIDFWAKNLLGKDYATFYFESMGSGFMQKGAPAQFGVTIGCQF